MAFDPRPVYLECAMKVGIWADTSTPPTQFIGPINITKLETTPIKQDDDDLISNIAGSVGETLATVKKPSEVGKLSMEFNSMPTDLLDLLIGATDSALSVSSSAVTDEVVTLALNVWVPLANQYISETGFSLKTAADASVTADKYVVDYIDGMIMAVNASAVGSMKANYTKEAVEGERYAAGKAVSSYLMLRGKARNKWTNQWGRLVVYQASVSNSAATDWAKGGWMTGTLDGKIITPTGYDAPMLFDYRNS